MIEQMDLKSLTRRINIGGGSFGTGWVSIKLILKHNNLLLKRKTPAIENNLLQYNIKENMNNIKA